MVQKHAEMKFWKNFCELVQKPDWIRSNQMELSIHVFPKPEVEALFKAKTQAEWIDLVGDLDVCLDPVKTISELLKDNHFDMQGSDPRGMKSTVEVNLKN